MNKILKGLFTFVLVCKIFSYYDSCGEQHTPIAINEWLKDKKFVSSNTTVAQTPEFGNVDKVTTTITIFAEIK